MHGVWGFGVGLAWHCVSQLRRLKKKKDLLQGILRKEPLSTTALTTSTTHFISFRISKSFCSLRKCHPDSRAGLRSIRILDSRAVPGLEGDLLLKRGHSVCSFVQPLEVYQRECQHAHSISKLQICTNCAATSGGSRAKQPTLTIRSEQVKLSVGSEAGQHQGWFT